uniref:Ycf21 n=1 Tax=Platysiphonia delicata TaxID=2006979 RepID=A0A1Z1M0X8_9FLOR|nr:hypothetical protein [Platysiphonia delicata]ARW59532.1 hypothetical protein [Platysiphonia delicata]
MHSHFITFNKFHKITISPRKHIHHLSEKTNTFMPVGWQIILINEGSLTSTLNMLENEEMKINVVQKKYRVSNKKEKKVRAIWMENSIYSKLMFAKSLWTLTYVNENEYQLELKKPLGTSFIQSEIDIYKSVCEIYYGYCKYLEKKMNYKGPIWGRKCIIHYENKNLITIQEFFSPGILNAFHKNS